LIQIVIRYLEYILMIYNKTIIVSSLNNLYKLLSKSYNKNNNFISKSIKSVEKNKIKYALMHYKICNMYTIRIWKINNNNYNYWYTDLLNYNLKEKIAYIDYEIKDGIIKIEYININKKEYNDYERYKIYNAMFKYIINYSKSLSTRGAIPILYVNKYKF